MTENNELPVKTEPAGAFNTGVNIFVSPAEAFVEIEQRPSKIIPLLLVMVSMSATLFWYFSILDFEWFVDDLLATFAEAEERGTVISIGDFAETGDNDAAREQMLSMSPNTFRLFGILGAMAGILLITVLQSSYLSLTTALSGDRIKFTHWFSLVAWTSLPALLSVTGMIVTLLLSPNGQLSSYDLDPLTLANLGMQSSNGSVQQIFNSLNLTIVWSTALIIMAHRQWLGSSWFKAVLIVTAPYLLILGIWAYFAFG